METQNRYFTKEGWYDALIDIVESEERRDFIAEFMASDARKFYSGKYMGNVNETTIDRSSLIIMVLSKLDDFSNIHFLEKIDANIQIHKSSVKYNTKEVLYRMRIENEFINDLVARFSDKSKDFYIFSLFSYIIDEGNSVEVMHKYYTK